MRAGWDPRAERSACGIGFVATADGREDRRVLDAALEALSRLEHRGAMSADGATTDGAGILTAIPRDLIAAELPLTDVEPPGSLGLAMLFAGRRTDREVQTPVVDACAAEGIEVVAWRDVPVRPEVLGPMARRSMPRVLQAVLRRAGDHPWSLADERRRTHRARRRLEREVAAGGCDLLSVCSLGFHTVTYKGLVSGDRLGDFYPDLQDPRFRAWFGVLHRRFSTNTSSTWERAQPFRRLCHNGEINTLSGNVARWRAREGALGLGDPHAERLMTPIVDEAGSDSSMLDEIVELLTSEGTVGEEPRTLAHAIATLVPPAWERDPRVAASARAFHRWHEARFEPWDGPAALVFADGRIVGAALDRNGLRPVRWSAGSDGLIACASESGVVDHGDARVRTGRLGPGEMLVVDPARGGLLLDPVADLAAARPYASWLELERTPTMPMTVVTPPVDLVARQVAHGVTREDLTLVLRPMASTGGEPVFSMGDDTAIPPLATAPRPVTSFLRQRFAQVTNPALDHLREGWVMTLRTSIGPRPAPLVDGPARIPMVELGSFFLDGRPDGYRLDATMPIADGPDGLRAALDRIAEEAVNAASAGEPVLVVDHASVGPARAPIASVLAIGAIHTSLERTHLRDRTSIVGVVDDVWGSHDAACLLSVGCDAVHPSLALATVEDLCTSGRVPGTPAEGRDRFRLAVEGGVRKALARLGISVLASYRGARALDALGLGEDVIDRCFPGVVTPFGGLSFPDLAVPTLDRHVAAYGTPTPAHENPGRVKHRRGGEHHGSNPDVVRALHRAVDPGLARLRSTAAGDRPTVDASGLGAPSHEDLAAAHILRRAVTDDDPDSYARFVTLVDRRPPLALRDLVRLRPTGQRIPVDEVEDVEALVRRFSTAAMSVGAISPEAHETIAVGARLAGARANSGEGGEHPARYGSVRSSAIKQVASARFGVTPDYLVAADELQIKIGQGSKPGEGGQLPGTKVSADISVLRHAQPGIALLSPAPHHDIYSIEDLAQLVFDLKQVNPHAAISVKLVASAGIGTISVGVAKALADVIHVSGADGGTGASPLASIKHAGMPWEMGVAEVRLALSEQGLRDRVRIRVDGGMRTGRDVVVAAMLGADEFSFGSAVLIAQGCLMVRTCHLDTCPVGIATQRPDLRARFAGTPAMVAAYLRFVAEDVRGHLAALGLRTLDEVVGRTDLLQADGDLLDLGTMLQPAPRVRSIVGGAQGRRPHTALGDRVAALSAEAPADPEGDPCFVITNRDRSVGAALAGRIASEGRAADGDLRVRFVGDAGQSFGAFLPDGIEFCLAGSANDGVGKGLAGGVIVVRPAPNVEEPAAVIGNAALYGATGGQLFAAGTAGERFAVRNSGAVAVVEGVSANGCEYMTGGVVMILGPVGPNLAAGMSGGRVYVLDPGRSLAPFVNEDTSVLVPSDPTDVLEIKDLLGRHAAHTGSDRALALLDGEEATIDAFRVIVPRGRSEPADRDSAAVLVPSP